ncbi:hypothetical protein KKB83_01730 [Patescibacteria group bacterium]|nr:hypothetical protein [Patescibacteria group bacterium]
MPLLWDYDINELKRSKSDRAKILLLERQINYGVDKGEKIKLAAVKKYWDKLNLFPRHRRLFEYLIWEK